MSVSQLATFLTSSAKMISEQKMTDKQVAGYLAKTKLTERLDDRVIEDLQGRGLIGPKTLEALHELRDRSRGLSIAAPIAAAPAYVEPPPPSSEEQAAVISEVRDYALNYSRRLPDFICTQVTRRYAALKPGTRGAGPANAEPSWQAQDTLTIRLSYFEQKEDYNLLLINNTPTKADYRSIGGATSTGDFGSLLKEIFERGTEARFEWDHWGKIRGRVTMAFAYHVSQARSQWHIVTDHSLDIVPAYSGVVSVDRETHQVLQVTLKAEQLPPDYPVKAANTKLDYDFVDLSGHSFLLPLKSETNMAGGDYLNRNQTEFRLYRKYSAESDIKFDTEVPPLPDDATKDVKDAKSPQPPAKKP